jgi:SOS response regulatory protein OraA/RecX
MTTYKTASAARLERELMEMGVDPLEIAEAVAEFEAAEDETMGLD